MRFQKGNTPWNKGLKNCFSEKSLEKLSKAISKAKKELYKDKTKNPFYGKKHTKEWKELMSNSMKGRKFTEETKKKMSLGGKGKHHSPKTEFKKDQIPWNKGKKHTKEAKKKMSKKLKELYKRGLTRPMLGKHHSERLKKHWSKIRKGTGVAILNKDPKFQKKRLKGLIKKPNKPEKIIIKMIKENNLPFNYVGDGQVIIGGLNPDFLSKNPKYIIEIFGDYWHNLPKQKEKDKRKLETYFKYGYKTLIVWEYELKNPSQVLNKINKFIEK